MLIYINKMPIIYKKMLNVNKKKMIINVNKMTNIFKKM